MSILRALQSKLLLPDHNAVDMSTHARVQSCSCVFPAQSESKKRKFPSMAYNDDAVHLRFHVQLVSDHADVDALVNPAGLRKAFPIPQLLNRTQL